MLADPLFWLFVLPGLLLGAYAQSRIKINIAKYSQVRTQDGITGAQVARRLLDSEGASRGSDRVHAGGVERSLRSRFQDIAVKSGSVLCTERVSRRNRSP